ncbi:hypothetical protein CCHL11_05700 [Colletotrichum chlorophyti]|uniref:Uncharacterized protein n=1 Tax=Colletotrichum chlorophyti TaxID=708187 RepID=A0A1Q8RTG2_9PEZI|nr:hypothetical protein CCHL11_05700 [Colletotrichum chlorophyti]
MAESTSPPSGTPLLGPPSLRTIWIADNWTSLLGGTVVAHIAHYQYLHRFRKPHPNPLKNARFWAIAGGGWMLSYLGIITLVAVAQARVNHYRDPDNRSQYRRS